MRPASKLIAMAGVLLYGGSGLRAMPSIPAVVSASIYSQGETPSQGVDPKKEPVAPPRVSGQAGTEVKEAGPEKTAAIGVTAAPSPAARETELGDVFEKQDRLVDAEKAYAKALETATGPEREDARRRLEKLLVKEHGIRSKYFDPWFEKFGTSFSEILFGALGAIPALLLLWGLKGILKFVGGFRGRKKLQIGEFVDATDKSAGLALAELIRYVIEEVKEYYKPRDRFLHGAFGSLVIVESPGSEELVELAAEVVPGGWSKLLGFITKGLFRPEYVVTGMIQEAGFSYSMVIKLLRNGATIQTWQADAPARELSRLQNDLALGVALYLKEVVEANGS
jgi:hypothetical protein